jgi:hypothetical protein
MNFGRAFSFVFEDSDWFKKIIIVALVSLIPIIGQLIGLGFALEIMKRVINNDRVVLPDFEFGGFLAKGFRAFIVTFVYAIPLIIFTLPMLIPSFLGNSVDTNVITTLTFAIGCICGGLAVIYGILMGFMLPAAFGKLVTTGSMGAAFRFREVFALVRKAPVAFLIALLGVAVGSIIAPLGAIACGIGVLLTMTYYFAIMGHFYGQAYNVAVSS